MELRDDLLYTRTHEWVRLDGTTATVGITDHAQCELGDVVFVELPEPGAKLERDAVFGTVESVKAVSDLCAPVSGVVAEVNPLLADQTELVNKDPYGEGWMLKMTLASDTAMDHLMTAAEYESHVQECGH